jgi:hypothetical protein
MAYWNYANACFQRLLSHRIPLGEGLAPDGTETVSCLWASLPSLSYCDAFQLEKEGELEKTRLFTNNQKTLPPSWMIRPQQFGWERWWWQYKASTWKQLGCWGSRWIRWNTPIKEHVRCKVIHVRFSLDMQVSKHLLIMPLPKKIDDIGINIS